MAQAELACAGAGAGDLVAANAAAAELDVTLAGLRTGLRASADPAELAELCHGLQECTRARELLREHVVALRFSSMEATREALGRLRALPTMAELLPVAAEELGLACGFRRTMISSVRGSTWRAEALWLAPDHDPALGRQIEEHLTGRDVPLEGGVLETELVRRRVAVIVQAREDRDPSELMVVARSSGYVAAPVCVGRRVVGFLQADCGDDRELTTLDRDSIATFADGLSLVVERTALLERLRRQQVRAREAFGAAEQRLAGLDGTETVLVRGDKKSVAVFRTAAGLRRTPVSSVDQLLTARERQVLELMVEGAANRRIADELVVAEETVKSHVRSISRKLRASSRADSVSRYLHLRMGEDA